MGDQDARSHVAVILERMASSAAPYGPGLTITREHRALLIGVAIGLRA